MSDKRYWKISHYPFGDILVAIFNDLLTAFNKFQKLEDPVTGKKVLSIPTSQQEGRINATNLFSDVSKTYFSVINNRN